MLPTPSHPEPINFDVTVRQPGTTFLALIPHPMHTEWKGKEYWQRCLNDLRLCNQEICNYCSTWIPHSTGSHSVDHFVPKDAAPNLAYEWTNFRYVSSRFNSRKGLRQIADPYAMQTNWFIIDFASFYIRPNLPVLTQNQINLALDTIEFLHFNDDEELVKERLTYFEHYINQDISFDYLQRRAPFLAYEIDRQNLRIE